MAQDYKRKISDMRLEAGKLMTEEQIAKCNGVIHTAALAAGGVGFIPIPVADAVPISAAQVAMVVGLGKIFGQAITDSAAKGLIGAAASTLVGRSLVKLIPIVGWAASAAVAAGVTEAIGWTIAVDFAKSARTEWQRKKNAEDSAKAYAAAEYYKKKAESGYEHNEEEVEEFYI